jgi:hypothetical protein
MLDLYVNQVGAVTPFALTPPILGSNDDSPQATTIYASVTNISASTQTLAVTISYAQLET